MTNTLYKLNRNVLIKDAIGTRQLFNRNVLIKDVIGTRQYKQLTLLSCFRIVLYKIFLQSPMCKEFSLVSCQASNHVKWEIETVAA